MENPSELEESEMKVGLGSVKAPTAEGTKLSMMASIERKEDGSTDSEDSTENAPPPTPAPPVASLPTQTPSYRPVPSPKSPNTKSTPSSKRTKKRSFMADVVSCLRGEITVDELNSRAARHRVTWSEGNVVSPGNTETSTPLPSRIASRVKAAVPIGRKMSKMKSLRSWRASRKDLTKSGGTSPSIESSSSFPPQVESNDNETGNDSTNSATTDGWMASLLRSDPRWQIMDFYDDVAQEGACSSSSVIATTTSTAGVNGVPPPPQNPLQSSPLLRAFSKASVFTVWRPTSRDAIRRMMTGDATGKGLDIKGKSAKMGQLSGFVPFLQIHREEEKSLIRTLPRDARIRIFFGSMRWRDEVAGTLSTISVEMMEDVSIAKKVLGEKTEDENKGDVDGGKSGIHRISSVEKLVSLDIVSEDRKEMAMRRMLWDMSDPKVWKVDDHAAAGFYGIDVAERLFWEAFVMRRDITREVGSPEDTGRPSEPSFQDMNFAATRKGAMLAAKATVHANTQGEKKAVTGASSATPPTLTTSDVPKAVLWQFNTVNPMCPKKLVMAYEENNRITPVVSDFDGFLMGTRGVRYEEPLCKEQVVMQEWSVSQVEKILSRRAASRSSESLTSSPPWTKCWLEVLKEEASRGFHPKMPPLGYGDPKSYSVVEAAVRRLRLANGAIRHGKECFNFYFPQELDDSFLVISDTLPGKVPWSYMSVKELQTFLCQKIDEGFTFPLNPKWVLCDPGWKEVYDRLLASGKPNVQKSIDAWLPPSSGLRQRIEDIHAKYPEGFVSHGVEGNAGVGDGDEDRDGTAAMDLAELQLSRYLTLQRAKRKLRAALLFTNLSMKRCESVDWADGKVRVQV